MRPFSHLASVPVSIRVPLLVALLMVLISAVISERVLNRLSHIQEGFLNGLAGTYLDGLSSTVLPAVLRSDVWEVFDALDRSASSYEALSPIETVVTGADGRVLAATDPNRIAPFSRLPDSYETRYGGGFVTIDRVAGIGFARRSLIYQGQQVGTIHAAFDVSHLFAERREILGTLLVTNGILAVLFALGGFLIVRQMIGPMRILEEHMRAAADGAAEPIPQRAFPSRRGEAASLFRGYNALVEAQRERADLALQLAEEEKLASLGRLSSGMAHEINNPLGGLFNAIDTLKTHGTAPGVRDTSIKLIERGLEGIREVVEAALATYRPERSNRPLSSDDLEDVRLLLKPELRRRRQSLAWDVNLEGGEIGIGGGPVRQAALNLLLNASAASPDGGEIGMSASRTNGHVRLEFRDQGSGFPVEVATLLIDPFPAQPVRAQQGLGLWMVRRMVDELGGKVTIAHRPEGGTAVTLILPATREGLTDEQIDAA